MHVGDFACTLDQLAKLMKTGRQTTTSLPLAVVGLVLALGAAGSAEAAPIFFEDFNSYSGNQNNTQGDTGLEVAHSGNVTGWSGSGAGAMHAVDLANLGGESNPSDWAIMFWTDNVITSSGIAANDSGITYDVDFDYGTAVYAGTHMSQATAASDGLVVDVLRASDNFVLATGTYQPGAWNNPGNVNLSAALQGTLQYTGDGTGDVKIRVSSLVPGSARFGGEIDNISVDIPEPATMSLLVLGGLAVLRRRRRRA